MKIASFIIFCCLGVTFARVSYDGYQLWRVDAPNEFSQKALKIIIEKQHFDVYSLSHNTVSFLVSPENKDLFQRHLARFGLNYQVTSQNIQTEIEAEFEKIAKQPRAFSLDQYNTFEDIEVYLQGVADSSDIATLVSIGQSIEGRNQWQLQLSTGGDGSKPVVWIDCGIHAREWITPATCLYGIDLLTSGNSAEASALLDRADVYILPVYNPDGYSYTWTDDRLWRKNRRPLDLCTGVDLNRNFDAMEWCGDGASSSQCSDTYCGASPASEIETQNGQAAMSALASRMIAMYSIHSYSQLFLYPFGYTSDLPAEDAELNACAVAGTAAIEAVAGTQYTSGPIAATIYPAAGTTVDYVYGIGVTYSYTLELRDTGEYGFELPADQIPITAEETWAGLFASIACIP